MLKRRGGKEVKCLVLWELEADHCGRSQRKEEDPSAPPPLPHSEAPIFPTSPTVVPKANPISFQPATNGRKGRPAGGKVNGYLIFAQLCREEETQIYTKVA